MSRTSITTTTYEYDDEGRVTKQVVVTVDDGYGGHVYTYNTGTTPTWTYPTTTTTGTSTTGTFGYGSGSHPGYIPPNDEETPPGVGA